MTNIEDLLKKLEDERKKGSLTDDVIKKFNSYGDVKLNTSLNTDSKTGNVHIDELNKTGKNYKNTAFNTAKDLGNEIFDAAQKQTNIEVAKNNIKNKRIDETREELLKTTGDFKDKQDIRYKEVQGIKDRQEKIANREANITAAKSGRYGDVFTDNQKANIKNDIIQKYGTNILNAEQYALNTNRQIDNDLLNVGLKELADKDKRDAFKNVLLDKENSYMLNAIKEASDGNKKAIKDVESFYQAYTRKKADDEFTRSENTERRSGLDKEFASLSPVKKGDMLRELTYKTKGFGSVVGYIPRLINNYPGLSLGELKGKVIKMGELALTGDQQLQSILAIPYDKQTEQQKAFVELTLGAAETAKKQGNQDLAATTYVNEIQRKGEQTGATPYVNDDSEAGKEAVKKVTDNPNSVRNTVDSRILTDTETRSNTQKKIDNNSVSNSIEATKRFNELFNRTKELKKSGRYKGSLSEARKKILKYIKTKYNI